MQLKLSKINETLLSGGTEELAAVVNHLTTVLNHKRLIGVGFSMGANILIKYLGEEAPRQECFECGISVCQGYDILRYQMAFFLTLPHFLSKFYQASI